jgi:hypothetical protein
MLITSKRCSPLSAGMIHYGQKRFERQMSHQAKSDQPNEYAIFESALIRVLTVPHSKLKSHLDYEKQARKQQQKRASSHASRVKG